MLSDYSDSKDFFGENLRIDYAKLKIVNGLGRLTLVGSVKNVTGDLFT